MLTAFSVLIPEIFNKSVMAVTSNGGGGGCIKTLWIGNPDIVSDQMWLRK